MDLAIIYILVTIKKKSNIIFPVPDFLQSKCAQFVVGRFQIFRYEITKLVIVQPKMKANSWLKCLAGYLHFFFSYIGQNVLVSNINFFNSLLSDLASLNLWWSWTSWTSWKSWICFSILHDLSYCSQSKIKYMTRFWFWVENAH